MTNEPPKPGPNAPLNPDLAARQDETHDTASTAPPLSTTGAEEGSQGEGWSWIWLIAVIASVILAIYFLL